MTRRFASGLAAVLGLALVPGLLTAAPPSERSRAKTLFFDRDYTRARAAWAAVRAQSQGGEAATALYWVARCSESLKEDERALREFTEYLALRPGDAVLAEEARTSRLTLATRLAKAGKAQHAAIVQQGLTDPSRTVRYYAALQLSTLGPGPGRAALPILSAIVKSEKDEELVERAKLAILRIDPAALPQVMRSVPRISSARQAHSVRVRILKPGKKEPEVSLSVPLVLAELVFKSLPDDAKRDLRGEGYDADTFLSRLRQLGPQQIIDIRGESGEVIQIWTE